MSPAGRPPMSGERKFAKLVIRLTDAEKELLDDAAVAANSPTATWARQLLIESAKSMVIKPAKKK